MFFDAVLDENYKPMFNGTPEETKEWLAARKDDEEVRSAVVCVGSTMKFVPVEAYLAR